MNPSNLINGVFFKKKSREIRAHVWWYDDGFLTYCKKNDYISDVWSCFSSSYFRVFFSNYNNYWMMSTDFNISVWINSFNLTAMKSILIRFNIMPTYSSEIIFSKFVMFSSIAFIKGSRNNNFLAQNQQTKNKNYYVS